MVRHPSLAVVILARHASFYLGEALDSVFSQDLLHSEVVVVDAGATDRTRRIVEDYGQEVRIVDAGGAEPGRAWNIGVAATRGRLVAFLDADDLWASSKSSRQIALMQAHPDLAMVCSDMTTTEGGVQSRGSWFEEKGFNGACTPSSIFLHDMVATPTVIVRREALMACGLFDEGLEFGQETDLWFRVALKHRFAAISEPLVVRRLHRGNITQDARRAARGRVQVWGRYKDAVVSHEPHLKRELLADFDAKRWELSLLEGVVAIHEGKRGEARNHFLKAIQAKPARPATWAFFGATFMGDRAIRVLRDAGMVRARKR